MINFRILAEKKGEEIGRVSNKGTGLTCKLGTCGYLMG